MLVRPRGPVRAIARASDALETAGFSVDFLDGWGFDDEEASQLITVIWHVVGAPGTHDPDRAAADVEEILTDSRSVVRVVGHRPTPDA